MFKPLLATTALVGSMLFLVPGAQAFDWDGPYVGGVVGVVNSTGTIDWTFSNFEFPGDPVTGTFEFSGLGALAGVTAGINFRLDDKLLVGIEGDASAAWLKNSGSIGEGEFFVGEFEEELRSLLTLRGRFGVLTNNDNTLFYVTGGLAGGNVKASAFLADEFSEDEPEAASMSGFVVGIIGGVGVEHAIKQNLTVKAEVLGYSLGSLDGTGYAGKGDSTATYNPAGIILRTGINFHF